ncbi:rhamnogalacturonan acetylesterase RgaE [Exidia glandulosa HHB12029]|uniref:Rhamnogalacturonan acetylesterase RgaE n=1 Tax=Exidia glandulosa HHB12029 TaxID=1314781 RepID=A0A165H6C5_EXIGL|nr:rhamnogalacturonan acetylesterase RgaE [Exidia glandulosa HHB12029]
MQFLRLLAFVAVACTSGSAATVYLAGDSTMAKNGGGAGTVWSGWGEFLKYSLNITVVNQAIGGRSARSFSREGRFTTIINTVKSGDFVIIEFGHNDGGSLTPTDNGRTDCPGDGAQTCQTTFDGVSETVLTYPAYLKNAASAMIAKGAKVIISSPTPNNPWEGGSFVYTPNRFTDYSRAAAAAVGASFVDHGQYTANRFQSLGLSTVDSYYPNDHTHTSPAGANTVAAAFVKGLLCGSAPLKTSVKNATASVPGSCI